MRKIVLAISVSLISLASFAQQSEQEEMITDRPDQTESASIVPAGHFQIETGFIYQGDNSGGVKSNETGFLTTLLRYGVNDNFEIRLGSAFLDDKTKPAREETTTVSGFAPIFAGLKLKMLQENGPVPGMAFLVTTEIPGTGLKEFTPDYPTTDLRFAMDHSITERIGMGVNLGGHWDGSDPQPSGVYSLVFGFTLMENTGLFIESYGYLPTGGHPDHRLDTGITFALKNNLQIDASGGIGLSDISPDFFVNAGISWRIPD